MKSKTKLMVYAIFLVFSLLSVSAGNSNISINYGWNGSSYVPYRLTSDGKLMTDINKVNLTAGALTVNNNIISTGNISTGDKIVFGLGEVIDNIVDGMVRITGNLNVTGDAYLNSMVFEGGNLTAELGKFTTLNVTGTSYLGSMTLQGGNITASLGIFTTLNVTGAAYLGNVTIESGNITPVANNTYSLGSPTLWWKDLYVSNNSIYIAGVSLSASADGILQWNGTAISNVAVQTGNNTVLGAAAGENVGIGTSSPTAKLDVAGTVNATQFTINGSDLYSLFAELTDKLGNTTAEIWGVTDNGTFSRILDLSTLMDNATIIRNYNKLGNTTAEIWSVVDNETFARLTGFSGENITSGSVADAYVADDLTIVSTKTINTTGGLNVSGGAYIGGNVGIGTLSPSEKLTVVGNVNITQNLTISGKITGSHKQELEVESIGDVEAGKGMVLLMHFNNDSTVGEDYNVTNNGTNIYDYSDAKNNGTAKNNLTYNPNGGMFSGAYEFDGVDDYIDAGNDTNLQIEGALTIEAWIKPLIGTFMNIVANYNNGNRAQYRFGVGTTGLLRLESADAGGTTFTFSTNPVADGVWSHVAVTRASSTGTINVYINGILDGNGTSANVPADSEVDNTEIGASGMGTENFNGTIDEVAIYNRSLSADEILEHYKKGFKNVVEGSTVFSDETRVKDNLIVQGNLSGDGDLIINPNGGNVGIGTTNPNSPAGVTGTILHVAGTPNVGIVLNETDADRQNWEMYVSGGQFVFANTTGNAKIVLNQNGNVGIGTTNPLYKLHIRPSTGTGSLAIGKSGYLALEDSGATTNSGIYNDATGSSNIKFDVHTGSAVVTAMTIATGGNVGIGDTDPSEATLSVQGGTICDADGVLGTCASDRRLKENIRPIENAVEYLKPFKPVEFNFIGENNTQTGLIAQDIQEVYPELIFKTGEEDYITYNDPGFKYILIKAVQEQQTQIGSLKSENQQLKQIICKDHPQEAICQ